MVSWRLGQKGLILPCIMLFKSAPLQDFYVPMVFELSTKFKKFQSTYIWSVFQYAFNTPTQPNLRERLS
jgi:hypothetical protein